jgi:hypothetical protein
MAGRAERVGGCRREVRAEGLLGGGGEPEVDNFDDSGVDVGDSTKIDLKEQNGRVWTGLIWLSIKTLGGVL